MPWKLPLGPGLDEHGGHPDTIPTSKSPFTLARYGLILKSDLTDGWVSTLVFLCQTIWPMLGNGRGIFLML